jgi:hypothetical protein
MTRLDVYLNDRPLQSLDVQGGSTSFAITKPSPAPGLLEVRGFENSELVARYRTQV